MIRKLLRLLLVPACLVLVGAGTVLGQSDTTAANDIVNDFYSLRFEPAGFDEVQSYYLGLRTGDVFSYAKLPFHTSLFLRAISDFENGFPSALKGYDVSKDRDRVVERIERRQRNQLDDSSDEALSKLGDRYSYLRGYDVVKYAASIESAVHLPALMAGVMDMIEERDRWLDDEQFRSYVAEFTARKAELNLRRSQAALRELAVTPGITSTSSGLLYSVEKRGAGARPTPTGRVKVRYSGYSMDDALVDGTDPGDEPEEFRVDEVIPGWSEALSMMREGAVWRIWVPPHLGYRDSPNLYVMPNDLLVFKIELVEVLDAVD